MENVWLLWFEQEQSLGEDTELLIGVYRSEESARAAIERVKNGAGFREAPEGFTIARYPLDKDHWTTGFVKD